jgi:hypothetical protein
MGQTVSLISVRVEMPTHGVLLRWSSKLAHWVPCEDEGGRAHTGSLVRVRRKGPHWDSY